MNKKFWISACQRFQPTDAILASSLSLGLNQRNHNLSLGLLIAWICIRCSQQLWYNRRDKEWGLKGLISIIIIGLITFQARTIIQLDDNPGGSIYIILSACIYVGACYNRDQKIRLIRWTSIAAIAINLQLLATGLSEGLDVMKPGWMIPINNEIFELGFGRINSLASMICYFTIIGFYGFRIDKSRFGRYLHTTSFLSGYFLCLKSTSEMAAGAPIIAATAACLACKRDYIPKIQFKKLKSILTISLAAISSLLVWLLVLKDKILFNATDGHYLHIGEQRRLDQWGCWLNNSIFAGNNKIAHGIGYNLDKISEICDNNQPDGGLILFISQHGLLGALSLILLLVFIARCIYDLRGAEMKSTYPSSSLFRCKFSEALIGMVLTVLICNLITPSYASAFLNSCLIGIIFSLNINTKSLKSG